MSSPLLSFLPAPAQQSCVFQARESRADFLIVLSSSSSALISLPSGKRGHVFHHKAHNCHAVAAKSELSHSGEESSLMAVLSGCGFPPPGSVAWIQLFATKDAAATEVFLHKLTPSLGTGFLPECFCRVGLCRFGWWFRLAGGSYRGATEYLPVRAQEGIAVSALPASRREGAACGHLHSHRMRAWGTATLCLGGTGHQQPRPAEPPG